MSRRTSPQEAAWYASAVIGRDVPGGTETTEVDGYFDASGKPTRADLKPPGWRIVEFSVRQAGR